MATWNAFYIGTGNAGHQALARASEQLRDLRQTFRGTLTLRQAPNASWIEVECTGYSEHEDLMRRLSKQMGSDVVGCLIQTTASVMSLHRFRHGEESRCLQYADGGWLTTRGAPERWEAETLFSEARLEEALESADSDAQAEELRRLFREECSTP